MAVVTTICGQKMTMTEFVRHIPRCARCAEFVHRIPRCARCSAWWVRRESVTPSE